MLLVELDIIKNMIGRVADRGPFGRLLLWIDDMVCAIAEQKLGLNILLCAGDNTGSANSLMREVVSKEFWKLPPMVTKQTS